MYRTDFRKQLDLKLEVDDCEYRPLLDARVMLILGS